MKICETRLPGVVIVEPRGFDDPRGFFMETWHQQRYQDCGLSACFVQDNVSLSVQGTLRGLHFQHPNAQGKLVYVLQGEVFDVAVDIAVGSPTFGHWFGLTLSERNRRQLYVPEGFAHGFYVTSEKALVVYKCTDFYVPQAEGRILWNDPDLAIEWPDGTPLLSAKDERGPRLKDIPLERLPRYRGIPGQSS
jgi:dTDP-4-dehydrorhamnose 3,5-epimerase